MSESEARSEPKASEVDRGSLVVYGATGFTGRLVVDEARRLGIDAILAGRNARALEAMAEEIGAPEVRVGDATKPATLEKLFEGAGAVVSCAGPFARLGEPVLRAAIESGAHYLDTTGEQLWMARMIDVHSSEAERRGTTAILAHAFEYAVGDCAARLAVEATPGAETVEVVNRVEGFGTSRGTKKSALDVLTKPALAVVNGRRREEMQLAHRGRFRFPDEDFDRVAVSYGGGEVLSAPSFAATVRTVRTYLAVPDAVATVAPWIVRGAGTFLTARLQRLLEARIERSAVGPGEERRDQPWWVMARVRAAGRETRVTVSGYDSYGITGVICAVGAQWLLAGKATRSGVMTSAQAFDSRAFLDALAPAGVAWRIDAI
jgi:short subunit dehydrogenase-like uncharacterized protein